MLVLKTAYIQGAMTTHILVPLPSQTILFFSCFSFFFSSLSACCYFMLIACGLCGLLYCGLHTFLIPATFFTIHVETMKRKHLT